MTDDGGTRGPEQTGDPAERFGRRAGELGREFEARAERFGVEAEATGRRLAADPTILGVSDLLLRLWGVVLLAVGAWFLADVTLGADLPAVDVGALWPFALIVMGLGVVTSGLTRRR
jgi:hypothetical protein